MTLGDLTPDRELARTLRAFDGTPARSRAELDGVARRIIAAADPLLAQRGDHAGPWWLFAVDWARALIPIGVTTALVATACIVWTARAPPGQQLAGALPAAVATDGLTQRLLYTLVAPVEQGVVPDASRRDR